MDDCIYCDIEQRDLKDRECECGLEAFWHCHVCKNVFLCTRCHEQLDHEHPLVSSGDAEKWESIGRVIYTIEHASHCKTEGCTRVCCHKMKRIISHAKNCERRLTNSCPLCRQLIALCCYHTKKCQIYGCKVPFCMNIRMKIAEDKEKGIRNGMTDKDEAGGSGLAKRSDEDGEEPSTSSSYNLRPRRLPNTSH